MDAAVYILGALTSGGCAVLLWRGWLRTRSRLLVWSAICFFGLAANNALLFVDKIVITDVDLSTARAGTALAALLVLLAGLIWESG